MRPLYEVGEEVILQSVSSPELNGDAFVLGVHTIGEALQILSNKYPGINWDFKGDIFVYVLTTPCVLIDREVFWSQSAIRKKHTPGKSFDAIMDKAKRGVKFGSQEWLSAKAGKFLENYEEGRVKRES